MEQRYKRREPDASTNKARETSDPRGFFAAAGSARDFIVLYRLPVAERAEPLVERDGGLTVVALQIRRHFRRTHASTRAVARDAHRRDTTTRAESSDTQHCGGFGWHGYVDRALPYLKITVVQVVEIRATVLGWARTFASIEAVVATSWSEAGVLGVE
jgi:hypothetical protein